VTSKQRLLAAIRGEKVDRVPAMPDFCIMFPMKFNGLTMWDLSGPRAKVPLHEARLAAFRHFGLDGWLDAGVEFQSPVEVESSILAESPEEISVEYVYHTAKGDLAERLVYPKHDGSWSVKHLVSDLEADLPKVECMLDCDPAEGYSTEHMERVQRDTGEDGVVFSGGGKPGINWWLGIRGSARGIMDVHDHLDRLLPLWHRWEELDLQRTRITCESGAQVIYGGGSYTSLSLISPEWYRRFVAPHLERAARLCHEYDIPFVAQTNGRCDAVLEMLAETGVDAVLPLERPPLGDVDLAEARRRLGTRFSFIGNVDPVNTLLRGTPGDVEREIQEIIASAGPRALIVSTSDQTARDTPHENLHAYREAVLKHGVGN